MPLKLIDHGTKEYKQMIDLRMLILRKPLGLTFSEEELEKEKEDLLMGAFEDDDMLGCCMLTRIDSATVRLRQMAVKTGLQGKGIGRVLMQFAENLSRDHGYSRLVMHARKTAAGFYEKLGYKICSEPFMEVTVEHYEMEKML